MVHSQKEGENCLSECIGTVVTANSLCFDVEVSLYGEKQEVEREIAEKQNSLKVKIFKMWHKCGFGGFP